MQMWSSGPGFGISGNAYLLSCTDRIADFDGRGTKMQVTDLYFPSIVTCVLNSDGLSTGCIGIFIHRYYLAVLFCRQHSLIVTLYVHPLVHLLFGSICRICTHTERRCNEQELFTFQRERIIMFRTVVIVGLQLRRPLRRFQPLGV